MDLLNTELVEKAGVMGESPRRYWQSGPGAMCGWQERPHPGWTRETSMPSGDAAVGEARLIGTLLSLEMRCDNTKKRRASHRKEITQVCKLIRRGRPLISYDLGRWSRQ